MPHITGYMVIIPSTMLSQQNNICPTFLPETYDHTELRMLPLFHFQCVSWYPGETKEHVIAIGQANGKVLLSK